MLQNAFYKKTKSCCPRREIVRCTVSSATPFDTGIIVFANSSDDILGISQTKGSRCDVSGNQHKLEDERTIEFVILNRVPAAPNKLSPRKSSTVFP